MNGILAATLVGMLFATGAYLIMRRDPIKLILGLTMVSYGVNVLLFSSSTLRDGIPPVIGDKSAFDGDISQFVDPLPQALILTAIVISFGITAFLVVLVSRRNALVEEHGGGQSDPTAINDPFGATVHYLSGLDSDPDDYVWLDDTYTGETGSDASAAKSARPHRQPATGKRD